jgi:hypothetical protein
VDEELGTKRSEAVEHGGRDIEIREGLPAVHGDGPAG